MRLVEYKNTTLKIELYFSGRAHKEFDVRIVDGHWPSDKDLITLCDGGDPEKPEEDQLHSGGSVFVTSDDAYRIVKVNR